MIQRHTKLESQYDVLCPICKFSRVKTSGRYSWKDALYVFLRDWLMEGRSSSILGFVAHGFEKWNVEKQCGEKRIQTLAQKTTKPRGPRWSEAWFVAGEECRSRCRKRQINVTFHCLLAKMSHYLSQKQDFALYIIVASCLVVRINEELNGLG